MKSILSLSLCLVFAVGNTGSFAAGKPAKPGKRATPEKDPSAATSESKPAKFAVPLPARDTVDSRIVASVRSRSGRVIEKETDLAAAERWPDYRS